MKDTETCKLLSWSMKNTLKCSFQEKNENNQHREIAVKSKFNSEYAPFLNIKKTTFNTAFVSSKDLHQTIVPYKNNLPEPTYHSSWELMRVISGHTGWVRSVTVDISNQWFATGSVDRTIKIWDLASGILKLSLTGHISTVRALQSSDRHPYLFSAGEDKMAKCWDLEQNKVIRHYHGHLSGIYALSLHPTLDILVTAGRDAVGRVWDMRTSQPIFTLTGHSNTISTICCQEYDPQVITASMDSTIRLWDLRLGKTFTVLTHHKRAVRALTIHPREFTFSSASSDHIKKFKLPNGEFLHNCINNSSQKQSPEVVNTLAINEDNVMIAGSDNGLLSFFDWKSGQCFQQIRTKVQPGSLEAEAGIYASSFDRTGLRYITCEADKTIKIWKEQEHS